MKNNIRENPILRKRIGFVGISVFRYLFLISVSYIVIFQLLYMLTYAFRPESDMYDNSIVWVNKINTLENFKLTLEYMDYVRAFITTLSIQVLSALIEVITCTLPAYGLARFKFKGKTALFICVMFTVIVPPQLIAVPMSLNFAYFDVLGILKLIGGLLGTELRPNLLGTGFTFWLPSLFGAGLRSGLFIFIYMQFFRNLPKELEEAAALDGASPFRTYTSIVLPSSGVVILTVTILSVVWHWNDTYFSELYFNENFPLSIMLQRVSDNMAGGLSADNRGTRMAACILFILPVLIMYTFLQRRFIKSIDRVGIVG